MAELRELVADIPPRPKQCVKMAAKGKIYPREGDRQTVYLKEVVSDPNIEVGEYTIYNDFAADPVGFERNNVLYHYPVNGDRLVIGKFCSLACGVRFLFNSANHTLGSLSHLSVPDFLGPRSGASTSRRWLRPGTTGATSSSAATCGSVTRLS